MAATAASNVIYSASESFLLLTHTQRSAALQLGRCSAKHDDGQIFSFELCHSSISVCVTRCTAWYLIRMLLVWMQREKNMLLKMFGVCSVWNADVDIVYCDAAQRKSTIRFMWDFDNILTERKRERETPITSGWCGILWSKTLNDSAVYAFTTEYRCFHCIVSEASFQRGKSECVDAGWFRRMAEAGTAENKQIFRCQNSSIISDSWPHVRMEMAGRDRANLTAETSFSRPFARKFFQCRINTFLIRGSVLQILLLLQIKRTSHSPISTNTSTNSKIQRQR